MQEILAKALKNLRYKVRVFMGTQPLLFEVMGHFSAFRDRITSKRCDICIEGFPRSANSYTTLAFRTLNPGLKISHHVHVPMQVRKAVRLGVPCLTLIRKPADALSSLLLIDQNLSYSTAIKSYISFYSSLEELKDEMIVADFSDVTKDFAMVVGKINEFYGTCFSTGSNTDLLDDKEIFRKLESHHKKDHNNPKYLIAVPSEEKERLKKDIKERLLKHPTFPAAEKVYRDFLGNS